jgi:hypothetical protein
MEFKSGHTYYCKHTPTGENWVILGVDEDRDRVCAAGWPATIGKLSDCTNFEDRGPITPEELEYRNRTFGTNWI